eukprot:6172367-Pleurochrysis_carterae.AAC.3
MLHAVHTRLGPAESGMQVTAPYRSMDLSDKLAVLSVVMVARRRGGCTECDKMTQSKRGFKSGYGATMREVDRSLQKWRWQLSDVLSAARVG